VIIVIVLSIAGLTLTDCNQNDGKFENKNLIGIDFAIISGNAIAGASAKIYLGDTVIPISNDGSFYHKLNLDKADFYTLSYKRKDIPLFISPGDSLYFDINNASPTITGSGAIVNVFLQKHTKLAKSNSNFLDKNNEAVFGLEPNEFNQKIDSLESKEINLLKGFIQQNKDAPVMLKKRLTDDITYRNKRYRLLYPHNYTRYKNFEKTADINPDYFEDLMKGSFDHSELLISSEYIRCMNYYFDILAVGKYKFQNLGFAPGERIIARYQSILDMEINQEIKDFFLGDHFNRHIWTYSVKALEYCYNLFKNDCKNEVIQKEVSQFIQIGYNRRNEAHDIQVFKCIGNIKLEAHIFYPEGFKINDKRPAHLNFYGGGWAMGMPEWSYNACKNAAANGRVSITFDYRLRHVHGASILESVSDALSAVVWVRENAVELGIDPEKILAEGFSAGGHLVACAAMIDNPKEFGVDSKFSSKPNVIILGSTPYDIRGRDVYGVEYDPASISPVDLVQNDLVPMLMFHGENDNIVRIQEFHRFIEKMKATNNDYTFHIFEGNGHYFNRVESDTKIMNQMKDEFLALHGF